MDGFNTIHPCANSHGSLWLKYAIFLGVAAVMYVYLELLENVETFKKIHKEIGTLKMQLDEYQYKLLKIKYDQEKQTFGIKNVISSEIEKFSSDKTGRTDFALESTGGKIMHLSPGTENFEKSVTFFGMTLCDGKHGPTAMIQADMSPGHCWAIKGTSGGAVIKLLGVVKIDSVSLEHISKNLSPTGEVASAPSNFSVWGLKHPSDRGVTLGTFSYKFSGPLVQTFPITNPKYFEYVEFRVLTNQGNPDFTCIYRFRVHGHLDKGTGHQ